jgi:hypothetical protein
MVDAEQLIRLIYDGVGDDAAWSDALAKVAELVRAAGVGLGIQDMKTHEFRSLGYFGIDGSLNPTYRRLAPSQPDLAGDRRPEAGAERSDGGSQTRIDADRALCRLVRAAALP